MSIISVIIAVYNEENYIRFCLSSLLKQSKLPDEIIIVDDGSTDNSLEIVKRLASSVKNLKILRQKHQGPAIARNFGARHAKGSILLFLDADMTYDPRFVAELIKPILNKKEIATFTRSEYVANADNIWARFWDYATFANLGKRMPKNQSHRSKIARAITASAFKMARGFKSSGFTDDASLLRRLGKTSAATDQAICYHFNPGSLTEVFVSSRWMGRDRTIPQKMRRLFIFSLPWSVVKAGWGVIQNKNILYFPFRIIFDFGYFWGLCNNLLLQQHGK